MTAIPNDGHFEVVWPRAARQTKQRSLAPRLTTLDGKTIAQIWDYVFRGDEVYLALEQELSRRYPKVRFISWREFGNTHGPDERSIVETLPQRLKELGADAAISAMGA